MADDLTAQLEFGRITPETCETLRAVWPLVDGAMVPMLDMMYAHILKHVCAHPEAVRTQGAVHQ